MTKPNTSCTIEMPASLRSDGVRDYPGMPFGFLSESAFGFAGILNGGWRAAKNGQQVPPRLRLATKASSYLAAFLKNGNSRTQQSALRLSGAGGQAEIVRQQWNFNPDSCTGEVQDHRVDLNGVSTLELTIQPEITAGKAVATLAGDWPEADRPPAVLLQLAGGSVLGQVDLTS